MTIALLPERSVIALGGPEREAFLQGLVTADIAGLEERTACYAALLTPQGKILFDFFVVSGPDGYLIDCSKAQAPALLQRLAMYKLRRDVTLEMMNDMAVAARWGDEPSDLPDGIVSYDDPRYPAAGKRLIGSADALSPLADGSSGDYDAHRIGFGLADSDADIGSGETFAHEANLDQLGGVSFTKGCYVGQEVVSRMEHRGTARSRIVIVEGFSATPDADTDVMAGDVRIGKLLSSSGALGLAFVRLDRLGKAMAGGDTVSVAGAAVKVRLADWARYEIPTGEAA